jgi:hypothetical protein
MTQRVWLPAAVTALFEVGDPVRPLRFRTADGDHIVCDQGRSWRAGDDPGATHILVRTADGRAYELRFEHEALRWTASRIEPPARPA